MKGASKMNEHCFNRAEISGKISSEPGFSHNLFGESFYTMAIDVKRLSGISDTVSVTVSDRTCDIAQLTLGVPVYIKGEYRSYNRHEASHTRLMLSLFAKELEFAKQSEDVNFITLCGYICKPVQFRQTPQKREIADMLVAVNRRFNKSDYIPCIAWGRNARFASQLPVGTLVGITGRIQSRQYVKVDENQKETLFTAFEVSVAKIETIVI